MKRMLWSSPVFYPLGHGVAFALLGETISDPLIIVPTAKTHDGGGVSTSRVEIPNLCVG